MSKINVYCHEGKVLRYEEVTEDMEISYYAVPSGIFRLVESYGDVDSSLLTEAQLPEKFKGLLGAEKNTLEGKFSDCEVSIIELTQ